MRIVLVLVLALSPLAAQPSPKFKERIPMGRAEAAAFVADARNLVLPVERRLMDEGLRGLEELMTREPRPPGLTATDIWDWLQGKRLEFAVMIGRMEIGARRQRAINETYDALQELKAQAAAEKDLDRKARLLAQAVRTGETLRILVAARDRKDPEMEEYFAQIKASRPMPTPTPGDL